MGSYGPCYSTSGDNGFSALSSLHHRYYSSDTGLETTSRERILWRNLNEHSSLRERAGFGTEAGEEDNAGGTARRLIRRIGGVIKVGKGSQVT